MHTKTTVLLALAVFQAVSCDTNFKTIVGNFADHDSPRKGNARLELHGENITQINTVNNWDTGNITIDVSEGGVGYSYVSFSYEVTPDGKGSFETFIYTTDPMTPSTISKYRPLNTKDFTFTYYGTHDVTNSSRNDVITFSFDSNITRCYGNSLWLYGNGSRVIQGGLLGNSLHVDMQIPEGVLALNQYGCDYSSGVSGSRHIATVPSPEADVGDIGLYQIYDTLDYTTDAASGVDSIPLPYGYEIQSYEGGVEWKNGEGQWNVTGGGVGSTHIDIGYEQDADTYGVVDFNLVVKKVR